MAARSPPLLAVLIGFTLLLLAPLGLVERATSIRLIRPRPGPFHIQDYSSAQELLSAHKAWQGATLQQLKGETIGQQNSRLPGVVLVSTPDSGWGNRLPSVVTGLLMAMVTDRIFLLQPNSEIFDYLDFNWDVDWRKYAANYNHATRCTVDYNRLIRPDFAWCNSANGTADVLQYVSRDYEVPLLEVNPALTSLLSRLFPEGNIYHHLATHLFQPSQLVLDSARPYNSLAQQCLVGMQIRSLKPVHGASIQPWDFAKQYVNITQGVALSHPGRVFVAADAPVFTHIRRMLPQRRVWWANLTVLDRANAGFNPGSDLSAFVDLYLLAQCKHIILTAGSSFGSLASGYSNVVPVYAIVGNHSRPYFNPTFWKGLTPEPMMYKYGVQDRGGMSDSAREAMACHPRATELEQLHP